VEESNPELDMVRPDFAAMYQMAGTIEEVLPRIHDKDKADKLRETLKARPAGVDKKDASIAPEADKTADSPRLFFDLRSAGIIPDCMIAQTKQNKNRGRIEDLWDKGVPIGIMKKGFYLGRVKFDAFWVVLELTALLILVGMVWLAWVGISGLMSPNRFALSQLITPLMMVGLLSAGLGLWVVVRWMAGQDPTIVLPYLLIAIVGLLSTEWLTRKLLRLA
jgi:hypothetical protein